MHQTVPNTTVQWSAVHNLPREYSDCHQHACSLGGPYTFRSASVLPRPVGSSAEFTRSGHRDVRCRWNVVERIQTRTKPGQGESSILLSPYLFIYTVSFQPPRYHIDSWEEMMMDRDQRLTGHARKQTVRIRPFLPSPTPLIQPLSQSEPVAPEGFATNSVWYTEKTQ